jgi:hypothetical protein
VTSLWEQLEARQLPVEPVALPMPDGSTVEVEVRALPPVEWDALVALHPPVGEGAERLRWDDATFRPALLAASVFAPDGSQRDAQWWENLWKSGGVPAGEIETLYFTALSVNDRSPQVRVGKPSRETPS